MRGLARFLLPHVDKKSTFFDVKSLSIRLSHYALQTQRLHHIVLLLAKIYKYHKNYNNALHEK